MPKLIKHLCFIGSTSMKKNKNSKITYLISYQHIELKIAQQSQNTFVFTNTRNVSYLEKVRKMTCFRSHVNQASTENRSIHSKIPQNFPYFACIFPQIGRASHLQSLQIEAKIISRRDKRERKFSPRSSCRGDSGVSDLQIRDTPALIQTDLRIISKQAQRLGNLKTLQKILHAAWHLRPLIANACMVLCAVWWFIRKT